MAHEQGFGVDRTDDGLVLMGVTPEHRCEKMPLSENSREEREVWNRSTLDDMRRKPINAIGI